MPLSVDRPAPVSTSNRGCASLAAPGEPSRIRATRRGAGHGADGTLLAVPHMNSVRAARCAAVGGSVGGTMSSVAAGGGGGGSGAAREALMQVRGRVAAVAAAQS